MLPFSARSRRYLGNLGRSSGSKGEHRRLRRRKGAPLMARILQAMMVAFVSGLMLAPYVFAQPTTFITIGSGSTTGLYYPTSVGMAKIINEANIGIRANARSTGGFVFQGGGLPTGGKKKKIGQKKKT